MKKVISIFLTFFLVIFIIVFFAVNNVSNKDNIESEKIKVVATLFPQYDFVKQVGKDKVDVTLLLQPGTEAHTFDPSPKDIIHINESDIFVYTGEYMEPWAENIAENIKEKVKVLDVTKNIKFEKENHNEGEIHDEHQHEYDPHVWLDISNAKVMVDNILEELINLDRKNKEYYTQNAKAYKEKLDNLNNDFEYVINTAKRNLICFGDKFSYMYFIHAYDLDYISTYDSCLAEAEPSISKILQIEKEIEKEGLPVIFYESLSEGKIAKQIAKDMKIKALVFSSVHTVSSKDIQRGATYISVMEQNLSNLKVALN